MAADDKVILTPEQAEALLPEGERIHNFANPGTGLLVGCDYGRDDAIAVLKNAVQIEIGGDGCKGMKHPLVVWDSKTHHTFFEADMAKVEAFEAARSR